MPSQEMRHAANRETGALDDSFAPLAALQAALRFWWFLFLLAAAGGLIGWLFYQANPPLYEAVGQFSAGIDFVRTGPLSEKDEDLAINQVGAVVNSTRTLREVVTRAAEEGIETDVAGLREAAVLERQVNTWILRVRSSDPRRAERLASIWVEQGQVALEAGYENAYEAERLLRLMRSLERCLEQAPSPESLSGQCKSQSFSEIQASLRELGKEYAAAQRASRGLFPGLVPGSIEPAALSTRPVTQGQAQVVLAGALLGLIASLLLLHLGLPARWFQKK